MRLFLIIAATALVSISGTIACFPTDLPPAAREYVLYYGQCRDMKIAGVSFKTPEVRLRIWGCDGEIPK